ncbi:PIN domain-containing protein [Caldicellulosiruptor morganii]|uniref:PIN domain-containing protein n=1 Tax=Caldicellulosiruptor morganii TaxID=1387555 RepID=A0ABY7BM36_9FIRM|nr:PIN domain-containing protein [Caldicellulosiruptor morganii]WAM33908.1 PIN domain-containing protein [Caldicellulosiruptor morganii]
MKKNKKRILKLIDANVILRLLLNDIAELNQVTRDIIKNNEVLILNEVVAEIIYVLEKLYKVERKEISNTLIKLFAHPNIFVQDLAVITGALKIYADKGVDFVDAVLVAQSKCNGYTVYTFDKKLEKLLQLE